MNFKDPAKVDGIRLYDKYIRPLNPSGEHEVSSRNFVTNIRFGKIKSEEEIETLAKSYDSYIEEWNNVYGYADKVFIKKEEQLKSFHQFYSAGMHKSKSFSTMDARYIYLFGQIEFSIVEERFKEFKEKTRSPWSNPG